MSSHLYKQRDFDFAQRLLTLRKRTRLTQEEVASRMGVSTKTIRNWEGGSNYPSGTHLEKLVDLYFDQMLLLYPSRHEQDEVHELWDQLRETLPNHIGLFDEQWFVRFLRARQVDKINSAQPLAASLPQEQLQASQTQPLTHSPLPKAVNQGRLFSRMSETPDVSVFYGRTNELAELEQWLLTDHCRLVAVIGMGGIGKTAMAAKLVHQVAPHFDCVLWRSLYNAPSLEELLSDWLQIFAEQYDANVPPHSVDHGITLLLKHLQEYRCLFVLDNLETLFQEGMPEKRYREGYEAYGTLIRRLAEAVHQSCLLLTSRELVPDLGIFTGRQAPVRMFRLGGLVLEASRDMLQDKGISGDYDTWSELVQRYAGNPLALKIVAETVHEIFGGDIAAFLARGVTTFQGVRLLLTQQFERLSELEQVLMYWLAIEREPISLETLEEEVQQPVTSSEIVEAMYSLRSRSLVERGEHEAVFTLQPVVLEYVTGRLIELVSEELCAGKPALLLTHMLLKGQAKDYIRSSQARFIVQPLLNRLLSRVGSAASLEDLLEHLLQCLRSLPRTIQRYGGGNAINLLVQLNGHMNGKDCSHLTIWQADLQRIEAHDANFAGSDLTGSVLMQTMDSIVSVAFSPNGHYLAGGSNNGQVRVWRASDGQLLLTLQAHSRLTWALAFNPESTLLASGGYEGEVKLWEIGSGQCVNILRGHTKWVECVAFHPAGRLLATCGDDGLIRLWDLQANRCIKTWHEQHGDGWSLAFSPDGRLLASGYGDGVIKVWDHANELCLWSTSTHRGSVFVAFSPDGELLVSGEEDAQIMVWQARSGRYLSSLSGHTDTVAVVAFNKEGLLASCSSDRTVKLWHIGQEEGTGQCVDTLQGHSDQVWSIAFGPDNRLVSGSLDGTIKLWQISKGGKTSKCLQTLHGYAGLIHTVALSPDGKLLLSDESNGMVRMWETRSGQCVRTFSKPASQSSTIVFSPDGHLIAGGLPDKTIKLWEVTSGQCVRTLQGHLGASWSIVFSADGRFLLSGSFDRTLKLWEVENGHCLATLEGHANWIWAVACSPDGRLLASGDIDGIVKLWERESGQCLHTLQGSPQAVLALTFTLDGSKLLSSNAQDLLTVWDVQSGRCLSILPGVGENYWLHSMAFSPDSCLLATASSDQTVKLWDVNRGELLGRFSCQNGQPWSVAFSADQTLLACGTDEGNILLWEWQTGKLLLTLRSDRPYERMNISGITGITEAQKASLKILGAIEKEDGIQPENMAQHIYQPEELMTPVQAYRTLGVTRQSLYNRLHKGKLTRGDLHGNLRFLRSEIEAWKAQRQQQGHDPKPVQ